MARVAIYIACILMGMACSKADSGEQRAGVAVTSPAGVTQLPVEKISAASVVKPVVSKSPVSVSTKRGVSNARPATATRRTPVPTSQQPSALPVPSPESKAAEAFTGRRIALAHTANMIGEIEPCG